MSGPPEVTLSPESIQAIVAGIVEALGATQARPRVVTASELAEALDVSRGYVYEHADQLGAERLGDGPKAHLRFDLERARELLRTCSGSRRPEPATKPDPKPREGTRRPKRSGTTSNLLPIRGTTSDRYRSDSLGRSRGGTMT